MGNDRLAATTGVQAGGGSVRLTGVLPRRSGVVGQVGGVRSLKRDALVERLMTEPRGALNDLHQARVLLPPQSCSACSQSVSRALPLTKPPQLRLEVPTICTSCLQKK